MEGKSHTLNKKTIIAIIAIVVLLAIVGVAIGIFLSDRGESSAFEDNQQQEIGDNSSSDDQNQEQNQNSDNNQNQEPNTDNNTENDAVNNETNNGTGNNANTEVTTGTNVNDVGETTVTRVEEEEKIVAKDFWDWWTPVSLAVEPAASNIDVKVPNLEVKKEAKTENGKNVVYAGEKITYTIAITNNGNAKVNNIEITDKIPENTTFVAFKDVEQNTIKAEEIKVANETVGVKWIATVDVGETIEVKFTVKVNEGVEGTISNVAIANGEESNETKTSIITANKSSVITRLNPETNKYEEVDIAKIGDRITYTITVTNTGEQKGNTNIEDIIPEGTKLISVQDQEVKENQEEIKWSEVEVPAGKEITREFVVEVININKEIKNTATVGGNNTNEDIVQTANIDIEKIVSKITTKNDIGKEVYITGEEIEGYEVKAGDVIEYTIKVTNTGSVDLTKVVVNEELDGVVVDADDLQIGNLKSGESKTITATYTVTYENDIKNKPEQKIYNKVTVTGKTNTTEPEEVYDEDDVETPVEEMPGINIDKTATAITDSNGIQRPLTYKVRPGDIIEYTIKVTNTGNTTLTDIIVTDSLKVTVNGEEKELQEQEDGSMASIVATIESLSSEVGKNVEEIKVYYTVVDSDTENSDPIYNVAKAIVPDGPNDFDDEEVPVNPNVTVNGTKTWQDNSNIYKTRPEKITVNLLQNGEKIKSTEVRVDEKGLWSYTFEKLPQYDATGKLYEYTVTENAVEGYQTSITGDATTGFIITNTLTGTTSVNGTKTWQDNSNTYKTRPEKITVNLLQNGKVIKSTEVRADAEGKWTYVFTDLEKYDATGKLYEYTVTEDAVEGYQTSITGNTTKGFIITNTLTGTTSVNVTKIWQDNNNTYETRPEKIVVNLLQNGEKIKSTEVRANAEGKWTYTFTDLEKYDATGKLYEYTVTEDAIDGYTTTISGYNITNTLTGTTSVNVTKTWQDNNDTYETRPEKIVVNLLQNGEKIKSTEVRADAEGKWTYVFTDLEKYDATGKLYEYTVTEDSVDGYTTTISGYNITNTLTLGITKTAKDENGNEISEIIYDPNVPSSKTFNYELSVTSQEFLEEPQVVTDILPNGIIVSEEWIKPGNVTIAVQQETGRQIITWSVDFSKVKSATLTIPVVVDEQVFKEFETDGGTEISVLDLIFTSTTEFTGTKNPRSRGVNIFLRAINPTDPESNNGYIYAGNIEVSNLVDGNTKFVSGYTDESVNEILASGNDDRIREMLIDFSKDNTDSVNGLGKYLKNGLPLKDDINQNLKELYNGTVEISPTQVILWYKVPNSVDETVDRYYTIKDRDNKTLFQGTLSLPECSYHIDGIIVDIKDLGDYIPEGTTVPVTNRATIENIYSDKTVDIIYQPSDIGTATINKESVKVIFKNGAETVINDDNRETYKLLKDDTIRYEITVSNTGNIDMTDVSVSDILSNNRKVNIEKIELVNDDGTRTEKNTLLSTATTDNLLGKTTLLKGETYVITVNYKVTAEDYSLINGEQIINNVSLTGKFNNENFEDSDDDILNINQAPEITRTKSAVIKNSNGDKKATAISGDTIEYTITVSNLGNIEGNTIVKDSDLKANIEAGYIELLDQIGNIVEDNIFDEEVIKVAYSDKIEYISVNSIASGEYNIIAEPGETVSITYKVKVSGVLPGDSIENSIGDGEDEKVKTEIEASVTVNKKVVKPQNTVIVIDMSLSMAQAVNNKDASASQKSDPMANTYENTRWYALKESLDSFLTQYLDGKNIVTIVGYNNDAEILITTKSLQEAQNAYKNILTRSQFENTRNKEIQLRVDSDVDNLKDNHYYGNAGETRLGSGTNIEDGLIKAIDAIEKQSSNDVETNVILMTDGEANRYIDNRGNVVDKNVTTEEAISQAAGQANKIKRDSKIYTVGLALTTTSGEFDYKAALAGISSGKDYAYDASTKDALNEAFSDISEEVSSTTKTATTKNGNISLDDLGLNVNKITNVVINVNGTKYEKSWADISSAYNANSNLINIKILANILGIPTITTDMEIIISV